MDLNHATRLGCWAVTALAMIGIGRMAKAADATGPSTIAISTDSAEMGSSAQRPVAAGAQLIIRTAELDAAIPEAIVVDDRLAGSAKPQAAGAAGQGRLTVVANRQSAAPAAAIVSDRDVTPAVAEDQLEAPAEDADEAGVLLVQAHQLSQSASSEGEYSQIVRWCAESMRHEPPAEHRQFALDLSAWALNRRGQVRTDEGERELGLADFGAALDLAPTYWRALHNRGVSRAQSGQFADAFDDVCRVIQLNPKFAKAYSNRATLYAQAGDLDHSLADYETALRLDPSLTAALVGHARACHLAGRRDDSLASFDAAIELAPQDAEIHCSRGDLLADLGRYKDALADYASAIDCNPQFEHAYRNGAWLLATCPHADVRDAEGALVGAQKSLECGYGDRHAALDTLAAAQANAGKFEQAVATMAQAIEIAPTEAHAAYDFRKQLYEAGRPFRTQPVAGVQEAEFVEDESVVASDGGGVKVNKLQSGYMETF